MNTKVTLTGTLEGMLEYFRSLKGWQIDQRKGHIQTPFKALACGCFGAHSHRYLDPSSIREGWDYGIGVALNSIYLNLYDRDIVAAWQRLGVEGYIPEPYGDEDWPIPPVETLQEIIRWRDIEDGCE